MQLTRYTDYSLRVLIYLAVDKHKKRVTIDEIAQCFAIPRNHLVKIVHQLGKLGYLNTLRGKGGGITLAKAPQQMGLGNIVRDMEHNLEPVNCTKPACRLQSGCTLRQVLQDARQAFLSTLDCYSLADLLTNPEQTRYLLEYPITVVDSAPKVSKEPMFALAGA